MTLLEALAILEAAVLECKKRDVDTPEVEDALDFLEPYIRPQWLIPQYRDYVPVHARTTRLISKVNSRCSRNLPWDSRLSTRVTRSTDGCSGAEVPRDTRHGGEG